MAVFMKYCIVTISVCLWITSIASPMCANVLRTHHMYTYETKVEEKKEKEIIKIEIVLAHISTQTYES